VNADRVQRVAIVGVGSLGLATAAHLALAGHDVRLWGRNSDKIDDLRRGNTVTAYGAIAGTANIGLATCDMEEAVEGAHSILVTTPAHAHVEVAAGLAPWLTELSSVVLNPGRTGGVLAFLHALAGHGCKRLPVVAETQTVLYACRALDASRVEVLGRKGAVLIAAYCRDGSRLRRTAPRLPSALEPFFQEARNLVETSIGNVGMVLHCAPMLLNTGWVEREGVSFRYYTEAISPSISGLLERVDAERQSVAAVLGTPVQSTLEWLCRSYGLDAGTLFTALNHNPAYREIDAPKTLEHRYILEDVPCGLVPIEQIAAALGMKLPTISLLIDLASALMTRDFRADGRTLARMGLDDSSAQGITEVFSQ
jgi:opine dehydrogenase